MFLIIAFLFKSLTNNLQAANPSFSMGRVAGKSFFYLCHSFLRKTTGYLLALTNLGGGGGGGWSLKGGRSGRSPSGSEKPVSPDGGSGAGGRLLEKNGIFDRPILVNGRTTDGQ